MIPLTLQRAKLIWNMWLKTPQWSYCVGSLVRQTKRRLVWFCYHGEKGNLPCSDTNVELPQKLLKNLVLQNPTNFE